MGDATTVVVFAFLGTLVSALAGIVVAVITNRSEKKQTAETTVEKTLRERVTLKDEQIADLKMDVIEGRDTIRDRNTTIADQKVTISEQKVTIEDQNATIRQQREELLQREATIEKLRSEVNDRDY